MTNIRRVQKAVLTAQKDIQDPYTAMLATAYWYGVYQGRAQFDDELSTAVSLVSEYLSDKELDDIYRLLAGKLPSIPTTPEIIPENIRQHFYDIWQDPNKGE